jgi:hypothetical protein
MTREKMAKLVLDLKKVKNILGYGWQKEICEKAIKVISETHDRKPMTKDEINLFVSKSGITITPQDCGFIVSMVEKYHGIEELFFGKEISNNEVKKTTHAERKTNTYGNDDDYVDYKNLIHFGVDVGGND